MGLEGFEAFCFDQALAFLDGEVNERCDKGVGKQKDAEKEAMARSRWLTKYIGGPEAASKVKGQYKDPASMF